jgi:hypothetical protein
MLFIKEIYVYCENVTKHTLCGQNEEVVFIEAGVTNSNCFVLKD